MSYNIKIIKENQHKTSEWSGGTTTQLYIYPENSLYSERKFKWRLSSAKVEVEKSIFTSLPGISRHIMVLEGELFLEHEGHHKAALKALQQDTFSGDWTTTSFGKVTDFNLMLAQGYKGELEAISFNSGEHKDILLYSNANDAKAFSQITEAFYIVQGYIEIDTGLKKKTGLSKGDLIMVTRTGKETTSEFKINSRCKEESKMVKASIFYYENS
ncbi:HutD/Ves family protein [Clostridium sp.]|uniref:HutD/Ves family protein n=1 Tax=Clostridium sp. TaxID=1506 RepID=UPI003D6CC0F6